MPTILPYGSWPSPITPERVTAGQVGLSQPLIDGDEALWLEARPEEQGRSVLVRSGAGGDSAALGPDWFNVRSRVHEYGGGACAAHGGRVVAANFRDQRLYDLSGGPQPRPLTPESGGALRYGDLTFDPHRPLVLAVREDHRGGGEAVNAIVAVRVDGGEDEGTVLVAGHDFVSAPRPSPDGRQLAWLSWEHPDMPWDATRLWRAARRPDGGLGEPVCVAGGDGGEAIVQPCWSPDGRLHFVSDRSGWWNLYRADAGAARPLCPMAAEFAGPAWSLGGAWFGFLDADTVVCRYTEDGLWRVALLRDGALSPFDLPYTEIGGLAVGARRVLLRAGAADRPSAIVALDPRSGAHRELRTGGELPVAPAYLARPQAVTFATDDGERAHALYYPPTNPDCQAPADELPPLIVRSHGGPTGSASSELRLALQYWTSRGFAVVDVNYGGSTGYGRAYRERLYGRWGVVDVADCVAAARHLVARGQADPKRLAITGGSAGGYTTLCALAFTDAFAAGASHYGVSDLEALARETHKFESRYLDKLVGPYPEARELYRARSPIHAAERLSCPVIFFQGAEDKIVPPNQAETMVAALRRKGLPVAYLAFEGEQHGFRRADTTHAVLRAELAFYARVFGFAPAEALPEVKIENLA